MPSSLTDIMSRIKQSRIFVVLPKQRELARRLCAARFGGFKHAAQIDRTLAGQTLSPFQVAAIVEAAICDYAERIGDCEASRQMRCEKDHLLEVILQDDPLAIALLQSHGFMTMPAVNQNEAPACQYDNFL